MKSVPSICLALILCAAFAAAPSHGADPDMKKVMTVARDTAKTRAEKAAAEVAKLETEMRAVEDKKSNAYATLEARRKKVGLYYQYHVAYAKYVQARFDLDELTAVIAQQVANKRFATDAQNAKLQELDTEITTNLATMREVNTAYRAVNDGERLEYPHRQYLVQLQKAAAAKDRKNN